jgi:predicted DNA-binding ribbon-helix-helix protein
VQFVGEKKMQENMDSVEGKSTLVSRNITVLDRRTSVRLEPEMWKALQEIARRERCRIHDICSLVSLRKKPDTSLTAAIRVFLMLYYKAASTEAGHEKAGHGNFGKMIHRARIAPDIMDPMPFYTKIAKANGVGIKLPEAPPPLSSPSKDGKWIAA